MTRICGVLLDIDDTLVDTRGAFRHALGQVGAEYLAPGFDVDELTHHWRADASGWYRAHTRGEMTHREQRFRRANEMHVAFGGAQMDADAYAVWDTSFERHFQDGWTAFADAAPMLDALEAAGIVYGAVSNAESAYQRTKLAAVGLERVPMLVGTDTFGVGKPDPRVFLEGARLLDLEPGECLYVGDEPDLDAVGAQRAGLHGVWLDRPGMARVHHSEGFEESGARRITSLDELPALLA